MIFAFRLHQELVDKQKTADHQSTAVSSRPVKILFGEFARRTSGGTSIPTQSTVASTARLLDSYFGVALDVNGMLSRLQLPATRILCHGNHAVVANANTFFVSAAGAIFQ
jgi:hypothetical protein